MRGLTFVGALCLLVVPLANSFRMPCATFRTQTSAGFVGACPLLHQTSSNPQKKREASSLRSHFGGDGRATPEGATFNEQDTMHIDVLSFDLDGTLWPTEEVTICRGGYVRISVFRE